MNTCTQLKINSIPCISKKMGGHEGAFINISSTNKKHYLCGKKFINDSKKEYKFYLELNKYVKENKLPKNYLNAFPKLYSTKLCTLNGNKYFQIENLRAKAGGADVKTLDFKIGRYTARKFNSNLKKELRHSFINKFLSTSRNLGFRLEGGNVTRLNTGIKKINKISLYSMKPDEIFNQFFKNKTKAKELLNSLKKLWTQFFYPNFLNAINNKLSFGFIGSSILIVSGNKRTFAKIIDLAHPQILLPDKFDLNKQKVIEDMTFGFYNLMITLESWI
jgi:hypothetical protein